MEKERYIIKVENKEVEVTKEVFKEYYRMERRERYQVERDTKQGVIYYTGLVKNEMNGEEIVTNGESTEDIIVKNTVNEILHNTLNDLKESDLELIRSLFFDGVKEKDFANKLGVSLNTVNRKKRRILRDLQNKLKSLEIYDYKKEIIRINGEK